MPASASGSDDDVESSDDELASALEAELFANDDAKVKDVAKANAGDGDSETKRAREGGALPRVVRRKAFRADDARGRGDEGTCAHPAFMFEICVVCGERKRDDGGGSKGEMRSGSGEEALRGHFTTSMRYIHEGLTLSNAELEKAKREEKERVLKDGKLTLILDLDHTLLNSAQFKELTQEQHDLLHQCIAQEANGLAERERPMLYCLRHMGFFTKLRPHVFEFLEEVSHICQPYVYTMGDKAYAKEMVKLIDPEGKIFHGRVISNNDSTSSHVKDLYIVLGGETSAVIVDDTERVWPANHGNLIRLDRYHFFPSSAASFQQKGQSVMERSMVDEGELGSMGARAVLLDVLAVIQSAHRSYFKHTSIEEESDVRTLLVKPDRIDLPLSGVKFVMSGVTPLSDRNPERHPLRLLASTLGAEFVSSIERDGNSVTHVIARSSGTDKVKWAKKTGGRVLIVEPSWLVACAQANTRVSESLYPIET